MRISRVERYFKIGKRAKGLKILETEGRRLYEIPYKHVLIQFGVDEPFPAKVINTHNYKSIDLPGNICPVAMNIIIGFVDSRIRGTKEKCKRRLMRNR